VPRRGDQLSDLPWDLGPRDRTASGRGRSALWARSPRRARTGRFRRWRA